jgi:drug/metabolite transporter (DMT)-like permease
MLTIGLSLMAALGYGAADYAAGLAGRRTGAISANLAVFGWGTLAAAVLLAASGAPAPRLAALWWGAVSGVGNGAGALALVAGFRAGDFSVAGPLSAVTGAFLAVLAGVAAGDRPGAVTWAGVLVALPAIAAVTCGWRGRRRRGPGRAAVWYGLAAGAGCAVSLAGLGSAGSSSGLWPVLAALSAGLVTVAAVAVARGWRPGRTRGASPACLVSGVLAAGAEACFFAAAHAGLLAVAAGVTSLFPAVTVALAAVPAGGERLTRVRLAGLALAVVAVALMSAGGAGQPLSG